MPAKVRDMRKMLVGKLRALEIERGKHEWYQVFEEGNLVANLPLSRGARELHDNLLGSICHQLHVSRRQLDDLLECRWSREDYITHVNGPR